MVEAVVEELSVKKALFASLDEICKPGVDPGHHHVEPARGRVRDGDRRPADVVGLHFFNPAPVMQLVEVVQTIRTSPEGVATARAVVPSLGKHPVVCGDRAGFIVNALLFPYLNDAVRMLEATYATADDIDAAMKTGCGYPMGPFELLDVVGLDVSLAIQRELYLEFREPGFAAGAAAGAPGHRGLPRPQGRAGASATTPALTAGCADPRPALARGRTPDREPAPVEHVSGAVRSRA